jgi:hypothetical protein
MFYDVCVLLRAAAVVLQESNERFDSVCVLDVCGRLVDLCLKAPARDGGMHDGAMVSMIGNRECVLLRLCQESTN